jgi:hypothetical protein
MAGSCERDNEPTGTIKARNFLTSSMTISFSRWTLLHGVCDVWDGIYRRWIVPRSLQCGYRCYVLTAIIQQCSGAIGNTDPFGGRGTSAGWGDYLPFVFGIREERRSMKCGPLTNLH